MADEGGVITRQEGPTIIHERTDSNGILDDLFKNVQNPRAETAVPLRQRNLPLSFFTPPKEASKEFSGVGHTTGYLHVRSRSSPASINQTLSVAPELNLSPSPYPGQEHHPAPTTHYRQKSVPAPQASHHHLQLFSSVNVNQHYKVGHLADGRIVFQNRVTNEVYHDSPGVRDQILGPLPDHWVAQNTSQGDRGEVYYVDHSNQATTWFDPRLPKDVQEPFVHSRHQQNQALQSQLQQQQQQQQLTGSRGLSSQQRQLSLAPVTQAQTPHSMLHQLQQHQVNFLPPGQGIYTSSTRSVPAAMPQQPPIQQTAQQQQTRVHELELERKNMRLRQEEIQKQLFNQQAAFGDQGAQIPQTLGVQENLMRRQLNDGRQIRDDYMGSPISPLANIRASDPFLYHGRQESDDSGFSPSTRHTPENFLAQNMEDLSIYANPSETWQSDQSMEVGGADVQQVDQIMSDGQDELSDIYFSDIESVLRNDKADPYATVTWL